MLKLPYRVISLNAPKPAAFRRLCVETILMSMLLAGALSQPPSGGCVLKLASERRP